MSRTGKACIVLISVAWACVDGLFTSPAPVIFLTLAGAGFAGLLLDSQRRGASASASGRTALLIAMQLVLLPLLPGLLAHLHQIPLGAVTLAWVFGSLGAETGVDRHGCLLLESLGEIRPIAITWEMAALPTLIRLAVAAAVVSRRGKLLYNLAMIAVTGALRVVAVAALLAGGVHASLAYEPFFTLAAFLPLSLLMDVRPSRGRANAFGLRIHPVFCAGMMALALLVGVGLGAWFGYRDPGHRGPGRVLIDESRSNWEPTDTPFDGRRHGQRTLYSYSLWKRWIELHFNTTVLEEPPDDEDLLQADALIIKTPTSPYDKASIERIERFVRRGGGLLLIGDHTNLYGMSTVLDRVASPYGISFRFDDTFPLDDRRRDIFRPPWLAPHPILRGIDRYPFETSCTLDVPLDASLVIVGRRLGAERGDYGHPNFFGDISLDASDRFGAFVQAAVVEHGRGRVAAFSDSTNFSSFSMLWPGRRRFTVNLIDWIARRSPDSPPVAMAGLFFCVPLMAIGLILLRGTGAWMRAAAAWALAVGLAAGAGLAARASARDAGPVEPVRSIQVAAFDRSLSDLRLSEASPVFEVADAGSWSRYDAFFIDTARTGLWPEVSDDLDDAASRAKAIVIIEPLRVPAEEQLNTLVSFVREGGRLLVLDSIRNAGSTAAQILGPFGIGMTRGLTPIEPATGEHSHPAIRLTAQNGEPTSLHAGVTVLRSRVGKGVVVAATDAAVFSDKALGGVYVTPDGDELRRREAQTLLLDLLLDEVDEAADG